MASKEELSDQLALMTKLAAQIERMAAAADKVEQSYTAQVDVVQRLASVVAQVNVQSAVQSIEVLNKSLADMQAKMKDSGKTSEAAFQKLGKKADETGKSFSQKFPKSVAVAVGALSGFTQGIKNVVALTKGLTGFFGTFVDGVVSITASIIAIPFKIFEGLIDLAAKSGGGMNELAQAIENLRKQFGALSGPTNKAIVSTAENLKGFKDTGLSAWRVFGTLAERLDYIRELATEMGGAFSKVRKEFEENGGALLGYQKGLGIANEDMKGVTRNAVSMGKLTSSNLKDMTKYSYELGDAFGLDAKLISRDMSKAMSDVKHFGGATTKQLAEASTYARKLGFELKDITGTLDQFDTFDTAAESAAKLSQAFGVNIDAFELMKAQSPAEQLELLRKSFKAAGVDASNFDRASLKLAATTTGLSEDVVQSALSMKNQGVNLDQIKKKSGEAEKKTLTQAEAMGKLADAIERMVKSGGAQTGGFWDMFVKGFLGGIQSSKEFRTIIWNIKMALQETYMQGVRLGRIFVDMFPGIKETLGAIGDFFQPAKFRKLTGGVVNILKDWMDELRSNNGNASFPGLMDRLQAQFFDFFNMETPAGRKLITNFRVVLDTIVKVVAQGIKWASTKVAEGISFVTDLINGKGLEGAGAAGQKGLGFMGKLLMPLVEALKGAWKTIQPALNTLLSTLAKKAWEWVKDNKDTFEKIGLVIMGYLFAMSLVRSATALLADVVVKSAAGLLSGTAQVLLKKIGGDVMSKMFAEAETEGISKSISSTITKSFSGASASGADVGSKIGESAAASMTAKSGGIGSAISSKLGASGVGSVMGAMMGAAAVYVLATEGKKWIDQQFAEMDKKDKARRSVGNAGTNAMSRLAPVEEKLQAINDLQNSIAANEKLIDEQKYNISGRAFKWATGAAEQQQHQLDIEKDTLAKLQAQVTSFDAATLAAGKKKADAENQTKKLTTPSRSADEFVGATSLDDAKEKLMSLEELSKKLKGKGFDIKAMIEGIKDQFKGINFTILDPEVAGTLGLGESQVKQIEGYVASIRQVATDVTATARGGKSGISGALTAVSEMVKQANALNDALSSSINRIDIKTKLESVAKSVGLGGKATYTVNPSKEVQITVNLHVTMDAGTVERVIIERQQSIIRDRLNFATNSPTEKGNSEISDTLGSTPKEIGSSGTKT